MKKLVLALAIMFCTVGAFADSVISCNDFYKNAKPNVDNEYIEDVFYIIKHDPDSYVCGRTPTHYISVSKSPYDGFGAMVLVSDTSTAVLNYVNDKASLITVDNYGFVRMVHIENKEYFHIRNVMISALKEDNPSATQYSNNNCPPSWQDASGICKSGWYSN